MFISVFRKVPALLLALFFLAACDPLISPFQEESYKNATTLKAQSLALIAKSSEPYSRHKTEAETLAVNVDAAFEYANGLPRNDVVTEQWDILRNPDRNLLGGFLKMWRERGSLSPFLRNEIAAQVSSAFDTIICVEINKKEATNCVN